VLVAVLSDIHANLTALDAVLEAAGGVDEVWHLGDVVGYGPDPDAVVDRLATIGAKGVRGNHDAAAVGELDVTDFHADARRAIEWTRDTIATATADWLQALEPTRREAEFTLVHGSPRDPTWEYILGRDSITANLDALTTPFGDVRWGSSDRATATRWTCPTGRCS
jgi:predicted phosphodiesterase